MTEDGEANRERETLLQKLARFDRDLMRRGVGSGAFRREAREAYRMVEGHQWDESDAAAMRAERKVPVVINRIAPMVNAVCGAEIQARQQVRYAPREPGDVQVNEILTGAVEWMREQTDAADEESQAFRDAVICGLGVTETRMDYDDDPEGMAPVERVDPLEMAVDPNARKPNLVDARYLRRARRYDRREARALFPELMRLSGGDWGEGAGFDGGTHHNYPGSAYADDDDYAASLPPGEVEVCEYQWRELEPVVYVADPMTGEIVALSEDQADELDGEGLLEGLNPLRTRRTRYWRAYRCGGRALKEPLPEGEFTYKFITGHIDQTLRHPYGLVRAMIDPQRWSNRFLAQIDWIIATSAKGGIMADVDAFDDPRRAEQDWARADSIIWTANGAVAKGKISNKPIPPYPQGMDRLMQLATASIPDVTGVNREMLGMAEQNQPGILEYQRKQAAYGVLAPFFDAMRRYRGLQGYLHLKMIQRYVRPGRLVRITNPQSGNEQFVPLAVQADVAKFDVIVDEAPQGPNQRERTWQALMGLGQFLGAFQGLPPQAVFKILEFSPLPSALVAELRDLIIGQQPDPAQQQQLQQMQQQIGMATAQADLAKKQADAMLARARAQGEMVDAQVAAQDAQIAAPRLQVEAQLGGLNAQAAAAKAQADIAKANAQALAASQAGQRGAFEQAMAVAEFGRAQSEDQRQDRQQALREYEALMRASRLGGDPPLPGA